MADKLGEVVRRMSSDIDELKRPESVGSLFRLNSFLDEFEARDQAVVMMVGSETNHFRLGSDFEGVGSKWGLMGTGLSVQPYLGGLGGSYYGWHTQRVVSPNNKFIDGFYGQVFIDNNTGSTTATHVTAAGSDHYVNEGPHLTAHWTFDEGTGSVAEDSTIYNLDAYVSGTGTALWTTGQFNSGLQLGSPAYVHIGSNTPLSDVEGAVSMWVNLQTYSGLDGTGSLQLFFYAGDPDGNGFGGHDEFYIGKVHDNKIRAGWSDPGDEDEANSDNPMATGVWTHIVSNWSTDENVVQLWVNGSYQADRSPAFTNNSKDNFAEHMYVGRSNAIDGRFIQGYVDDIRMYDRFLATGDIVQLYENNVDLISGRAIYSEIVAMNAANFDTVTLTATEVLPTGTSVSYQVSPDSGLNWEPVPSGQAYKFLNTGSIMLWNAELSGSGAALDSITLKYTTR